MPKKKPKAKNRYLAIIERVFLDHYKEGAKEMDFERDELVRAAKRLKIAPPKNIGDIIYANRYRVVLPASVTATQPEGFTWMIVGKGQAKYAFMLSRVTRIIPNPDLVTIKVPDATPEIVVGYAQTDEQALLAKVRYNRLVDIFLGITAYSLQNHLRTTVGKIGQIEIDEVYVGLDRSGRQFVVPVQAKDGSDQISAVQTKQDIACCEDKFSRAICRPVSAQFIDDDLIALFELTAEGDEIKVVDEKHYRLVSADSITKSDLEGYGRR
jgi:hypothetical protein